MKKSIIKKVSYKNYNKPSYKFLKILVDFLIVSNVTVQGIITTMPVDPKVIGWISWGFAVLLFIAGAWKALTTKETIEDEK